MVETQTALGPCQGGGACVPPSPGDGDEQEKPPLTLAASLGASRTPRALLLCPPLMCFTHVTNIEGICFLKPVLIEIAHKLAHAWGLPVSYYFFFFSFWGKIMFLRQTGKTTGKKGCVCFFSLQLAIGALPHGGEDGTGPWHWGEPARFGVSGAVPWLWQQGWGLSGCNPCLRWGVMAWWGSCVGGEKSF